MPPADEVRTRCLLITVFPSVFTILTDTDCGCGGSHRADGRNVAAFHRHRGGCQQEQVIQWRSRQAARRRRRTSGQQNEAAARTRRGRRFGGCSLGPRSAALRNAPIASATSWSTAGSSAARRSRTPPKAAGAGRLGERLVELGLLSEIRRDASAQRAVPHPGRRPAGRGAARDRDCARRVLRTRTTTTCSRWCSPTVRSRSRSPTRSTPTPWRCCVRFPVDEVRLALGPPTLLRSRVNQTYRALSAVNSDIEAFRANEIALEPIDTPDVVVDPHAPIVQVVNKIVTQALRDRASDVHIEPAEDCGARSVPHRRRAQGRRRAPGRDGARRSSAASRSWPR